jgi:large subunit ribosomal protein L24
MENKMNMQIPKNQKKFKIKKGDEVIVIAGRNKGTSGKVDRLDYKKDRVFLEGINIYKRHQKPGGANQEGGIIDKVMPLAISNVALKDPKTGKPTRVGYRIEGDRKVRFAKKSGVVLS